MKVCVSGLSLLLFLISTPAFAEDQVDPAVMEQVMAPGAAAMEAGGTLRNEMILGGRFLQQTGVGTMQEDGTLLLVGHDDNPPLGSQDYEFRMSFEGEDEYSMEIHLSLDGSEMFKMVEWTATRN